MRQFIVLSSVLLGCLTQQLFGQVRLKGDVRALGNADLYIEYHEGGLLKNTTVKVIDGKFSWEAPVTETQKITMVFPGRATWIFVEPGDMTITGTRDSVETLKVTGSPTNDEAVAYAKNLRVLEEKENIIYAQHDKKSPELELEKEILLRSIADQKKKMINEYVAKHSASALSLNLVTEYSQLGTYENVSKMYDALSEKMRITFEGKRLATRLAVLKRSAVGEKMMAFAQKDDKGKLINLSDFKGKYVLIDFWASWCAPCRREIPNLIKAYSQFNGKNFTIVSISLDDDNKSWLRAVSTFNMPWAQVSDLNGWDNPLAVYYGLKGIPSTLLVDPNGIIIAKDLRGITLNKKLEELFN